MVTEPEVITVPEFDLPVPIKLIPEIESPVDQVQVPAGTKTVPPVLTWLTALWTSV